MTNFAATVPHAYNGKHNMASDAFQTLRNEQARGEASNSMSFADLVDTINPLQHIPFVSTIYREVTGDQISNQARIAGGALYGGPIGFVASMVNSAIDLATGEDLGGHVMASLFGSDTPDAATPVKVASADKTGTAAAAADASLITGSIDPALARPAMKSAPAKSVAAPEKTATQIATSVDGTKPQPALPQLSPEAFNALIGSFADPEAAKKANAVLAREIAAHAAGAPAAAATATAATVTDTPVAAASALASPSSGIAGKMQSGLDQLDALKAAQAKSLSLGATTNGLAGTGTF